MIHKSTPLQGAKNHKAAKFILTGAITSNPNYETVREIHVIMFYAKNCIQNTLSHIHTAMIKTK